MKNIIRIATITGCLFFGVANAQWTNSYPKLNDFGHQIYLEQHELPVVGHGVTDPAASPNGKHLAIASKGWLWLLDLDTGVATRITDTAATDSRPRWSADGSHIAFVRDYGNDTAVVVKNIKSNEEQTINTDAIDIDPEFSKDGKYLIFASGKEGSLDLHRWDITGQYSQPLTALRQVERNPRRLASGEGFVYLHGSGAHRTLRLRNLLSGSDEIVNQQTLTYHLSADVHPVLDLMVYSAPIDNDYHLFTMDLADNRVKHRLTTDGSFALTPSFSADGSHIYFVTLVEDRQFQLMSMPTHGGQATPIDITKWDYSASLGELKLAAQQEKMGEVVARVSIQNAQGHLVTNPYGPTFIDSQTGRSYFYLDGSASFTLPTGQYTVEMVRGPQTPIVRQQFNIKAGVTSELALTVKPIWDAGAAGYASADFHVHLNGDGHHRATHDDALVQMQGEDLTMLSPQSWNRWERRIDADIVGKVSNKDAFTVVQGQEVRSHFHGHIGLINIKEPFAPWFFGPTNPVLGDPNLTNSMVFEHANQVGAFATYVHPISTDGNPFAEENINSIPLELVSDGVLEPHMGLELVCAWTSPLGTAQMWYRLLNIGKPIIAMSGTDTWIDFHRTPAVGTGRAYIRPQTSEDLNPIIAGALAGRSVLTTGPMLDFSLADGLKPGDITEQGKQKYSLKIASLWPLERVEIIVNGAVTKTLEGVSTQQLKEYTGTIDLPSGGWVAARAYSSTQEKDSWPTMHVRPFVHSSPIWINSLGSTTPDSYQLAAEDLLKALNAAESRAKLAYGKRPMSKLYERFEQAEAWLVQNSIKK